jgi:hypothetical protein
MPRATLPAVLLFVALSALWWACGNSTGPSSDLMVSAPNETISVGARVKLTATISSSNGGRQDVSSQATWSATPTGIVSIDSTGVATGLAAGTVTVTATFDGQHALGSVTVGTAPPTPSLTVRVSGFVTDAANVRLPDALVSATSSGTNLTTNSDELGNYQLNVPAGSYQVQVSADGFNSANQTIAVSSNTTVNFALTPNAMSTGFGGDWQIVLSAPPDCASTLPADTRQITFTGAIGIANGAIVLNMPNLQASASGPFIVNGQLFGSAVTFDLPEFNYYGSVSGLLVQQLAPTQWLGIFGTISGTLAGSTIQGTLTGEFDDFETADAKTLPVTPTASCPGMGTVAFTRVVQSSAHRIRR